MRIKINSVYKKLNLRNIIIVCSVCVLVFSLVMIGLRLFGYYHDNVQYEQLREQVAAVNDSVNPDLDEDEKVAKNSDALPYLLVYGNPDSLNPDGILTQYAGLKEQNGDLAGWIIMPGFKKPLDYPVMKAHNNEFYLSKDFYKNSSYAGSIFMDYRNNQYDVDRNIVIYGHAMNDNSMFGNLKNYFQRTDYYTECRTIYLDLMNTRLKYEVFSAYYEKASYDYRTINFSSDGEFMDFINKVKSKSVYDYDVELTPKDKILTLSTCNNGLGDDVRSIIHARLVQQIVYNNHDTGMNASELGNDGQDIEHNPVVANVYLQQLAVLYITPDDELKTAKLDPPFHTSWGKFTASVPTGTDTISLQIETTDPKATMSVNMNNKKVSDLSSIPIGDGENIIQIRITARDGQFSRIYTVTVIPYGSIISKDSSFNNTNK